MKFICERCFSLYETDDEPIPMDGICEDCYAWEYTKDEEYTLEDGADQTASGLSSKTSGGRLPDA
jgi:hypothetical protein